MLHVIQRIRGSLYGPLLVIALLPVTAAAQFPNAIQIFMPNGGLPDQAVRFTLTRDDGRIETLFTDTKGKFLLTGDLSASYMSSGTVRRAGQNLIPQAMVALCV